VRGPAPGLGTGTSWGRPRTCRKPAESFNQELQAHPGGGPEPAENLPKAEIRSYRHILGEAQNLPKTCRKLKSGATGTSSGNPWQPLATPGNPWQPLATPGNPWQPEVPTGTQWVPLAELFFLVELAFVLSPLPRFVLSPTLFLLASHTPKGLVIRLASQRERPGWGVVQASFPITATPASGKNTFCSVPGIPLAWELGIGCHIA